MATGNRNGRGRSAGRRIRVGDEVVYDSGLHRWRAIVIEDRGNLGVGGRRIWRIRTLSDSPGAEHEVETPEDELTLVA
jgi:hypothetical protein